MHERPQPHGGKISIRLLAPYIFSAAALATSACTNNDNPLNPPIGQLRVANAIADSQPIDATVSNIPSGIDNVVFGTGSGLKDVPDGSYDVHLTTVHNSSQVGFTAASTHIDKHHATTVYAIGRLSADTQAAFVVEADEPEIMSNQSEAQFVNAASQHPGPLDFYVTAPGAALASSIPTTTLSFPANNQTAIFTPGAYRIRVTPQGNSLTVIYDSGSVQFPSATTQQFALLDNADLSADSPPFLLVLGGQGSSSTIANAP